MAGTAGQMSVAGTGPARWSPVGSVVVVVGGSVPVVDGAVVVVVGGAAASSSPEQATTVRLARRTATATGLERTLHAGTGPTASSVQPVADLVPTCVWRISPALVIALDERFGEPVDAYVNGSQVW